ncbi:unnamed protein product [Coregonus sp. 'balchen']|nr:unnamed protein product [Coregonus sp. 'balchen']
MGRVLGHLRHGRVVPRHQRQRAVPAGEADPCLYDPALPRGAREGHQEGEEVCTDPQVPAGHALRAVRLQQWQDVQAQVLWRVYGRPLLQPAHHHHRRGGVPLPRGRHLQAQDDVHQDVLLPPRLSTRQRHLPVLAHAQNDRGL